LIYQSAVFPIIQIVSVVSVALYYCFSKFFKDRLLV
jgi:hypothetical protein